MFILICLFCRFILMKFFIKFFIKGHIREKLKQHKLAFFVIIILNKSNVIGFVTFFFIQLHYRLHYQVQLVM